MSDKKPDAKPADGTAKPAEAAGGGGIKAFIPLIANVLLMPVFAYVMTVFVLLPKMNGSVAAQAKTEHAEAAEGGHGAAPAESGGKHGGGKEKISVALPGKVLVNVSGTAGTRYLMAGLMLVGTSAELKEAIEKNDAQLHDVAGSVLATKTITDLDKPGARNLIRTELISAFNGILGEGRVKEIYFTEFAIQ
jgi:flagellar protein FliL